MAQSITVAMVQQYQANVLMAAQQRFSKFRGSIQFEQANAEGAYYERLGTVEAQLNNTRHAPTPNHEIEHTRRHVLMAEYVINLILDRADAAQVLIDPMSRYAQAEGAGMGRKIDQIVAAAAIGTARTGKDGSGTETWPQNNAQGNSMQIAHGGTGLTKAKIIQAATLLNEGDVEDEDRYFFYTARGLEDLLNDDTLTTKDRLNGQALQAGSFAETWMGFHWKRCEQLVKVSTTRSGLAFQKQALGVKYAIDMSSRISERADLNYAMQAWSQMVLGAVRIDPHRLVEVQWAE